MHRGREQQGAGLEKVEGSSQQSMQGVQTQVNSVIWPTLLFPGISQVETVGWFSKEGWLVLERLPCCPGPDAGRPSHLWASFPFKENKGIWQDDS